MKHIVKDAVLSESAYKKKLFIEGPWQHAQALGVAAPGKPQLESKDYFDELIAKSKRICQERSGSRQRLHDRRAERLERLQKLEKDLLPDKLSTATLQKVLNHKHCGSPRKFNTLQSSSRFSGAKENPSFMPRRSFDDNRLEQNPIDLAKYYKKKMLDSMGVPEQPTIREVFCDPSTSMIKPVSFEEVYFQNCLSSAFEVHPESGDIRPKPWDEEFPSGCVVEQPTPSMEDKELINVLGELWRRSDA